MIMMMNRCCCSYRTTATTTTTMNMQQQQVLQRHNNIVTELLPSSLSYHGKVSQLTGVFLRTAAVAAAAAATSTAVVVDVSHQQQRKYYNHYYYYSNNLPEGYHFSSHHRISNSRSSRSRSSSTSSSGSSRFSGCLLSTRTTLFQQQQLRCHQCPTFISSSIIQQQQQQQQQQRYSLSLLFHRRCRLQSTITTTTKAPENDDGVTTTTTSTSDWNIDETNPNPNTVTISPEHVPWRVNRQYIVPPTKVQQKNDDTTKQQHQKTMVLRPVPDHIIKPVYATTGDSISSHDTDFLHRRHHMTEDGIPLYNQPSDTTFINYMRHSSQIAATVLQRTCYYAQQLPSQRSISQEEQQPQQLEDSNNSTTTSTNNKSPYKTTEDIDVFVHDTIIQQYNCYPSPLNYAQFPKSVCTSVNEIICHGIPSKSQYIQYGDIVSIDISCYTQNKVHGDNCATIIVGDYNDNDDDDTSTILDIDDTTNKYRNHYRNYIYPQSIKKTRTQFATKECYEHFIEARKLVRVTYHALMQSIASIRPNISYLSDIGLICQSIAEQYGYSSVTKYRGHGIGYEFHTPPFIKHYKNQDHIRIQPGMIFTIEPMICQYKPDCFEWMTDQWTVSTVDHGLSAQFEHTILITNTGVEILTLPMGHPYIQKDYVF